MTTTTRSFERRWWPLVLLSAAAVCACRTPADEFFELDPDSPKYRATQTRYFETDDPNELLSASAAALQDLGFHIEESERELGFLRAAKERSAREYGQELIRGFVQTLSMLILLPNRYPIDLHQQIAAALVILPDLERPERYQARVMFYRVIWQGSGVVGREELPPGEQRMQMIRDEEIYRRFFASLSRAVFLEAYSL